MGLAGNGTLDLDHGAFKIGSFNSGGGVDKVFPGPSLVDRCHQVGLILTVGEGSPLEGLCKEVSVALEGKSGNLH